MSYKLKQEIETAIKNTVFKILKKDMGEEAKSINIQTVDNTIIIRFGGILSHAEKYFVRDKRNMKLMKELKDKLIEKIEPALKTTIEDIIGMNVTDIYSGVDIETEERIEVVTLDGNLDKL